MSTKSEDTSRLEKIRAMAGAIEPDGAPVTTNLPARSDQRVLTDLELREISSSDLNPFDAAVQALTQKGIALHDAQIEIGSGFTFTDQKRRLEGTPVLFVSWEFGDSRNYMSTYVIAHVVTKAGDTMKIVDMTKGGIRDQLMEYSTRTGRYGGLVAREGVTLSEYDLLDDDGNKTGTGTSYYLNV